MSQNRRPLIIAALEFEFQFGKITVFDCGGSERASVADDQMPVLLVVTYGFSPSQPTRRRSSGCAPCCCTSTTTTSPRPLAGSTQMMWRSAMVAVELSAALSDRCGWPEMVQCVAARAWIRGEDSPANVSQDPVLAKVIPARGFEDTAEGQRDPGPNVSCGRQGYIETASDECEGRRQTLCCPARRRTCRQKRETGGAPGSTAGQEHDRMFGLARRKQ
jgi:hypothetical protein